MDCNIRMSKVLIQVACAITRCLHKHLSQSASDVAKRYKYQEEKNTWILVDLCDDDLVNKWFK